VFHVPIWGGLELCLGGLSPPKPPRSDGTGPILMLHSFFALGFIRHVCRLAGTKLSVFVGDHLPKISNKTRNRTGSAKILSIRLTSFMPRQFSISLTLFWGLMMQL